MTKWSITLKLVKIIYKSKQNDASSIRNNHERYPQLFDVKNAKRTKTHVVYINKGISCTSPLYVKQVDEYSTLLFTCTKQNYNVYPNFIRNLLFWARYPRTFEATNYLGNHVIIGSKGIRETIYGTTEVSQKHVLIASKRHYNYTLESPKQLVTRTKLSSRQVAQTLWDDICEFVENPARLACAPPENYDKIVMKTNKKERSYSIHEIIRIVKNFSHILAKMPNRNQDVFIRLPYIRHSQLKAVAKSIEKGTLISDSYSKTTLLILGP